MTLNTTFALAKEAGDCKELARALGGIGVYGQDTPFSLALVLDVCGLGGALSCLRFALPEQAALKRWVMSMVLADALERVEHLMQDERSKTIAPMLRRHALSPLAWEAWDAEKDASWAAENGGEAERAAAWAAHWNAGDAGDDFWDVALAVAARAVAEGDAAAGAWLAGRLGQYLSGEIAPPDSILQERNRP